MNNIHDITLKLERLAEKQIIWQKMTPAQKLPYLEDAWKQYQTLGPSGLSEMVGVPTADLKGVTEGGPERELIKAEEALLGASFAGQIEAMIETYKVLIGTSEHKDEFLSFTKRVEGDQVVASVFPLLKKDKEGMMGSNQGEIWFQADVKTEDVQAFDYNKCQDTKDGVLCILGAGNYNGLTGCDIVHGLFVRNRCVFAKLHPLRPFFDKFLRTIFAKLYQDGFLDSEPDQSLERTKAIVYSDLVTSVHMTGGKATHDAVVWGSTPEEQEKNKSAGTPILKANMTSELGAASPYIMTDAEYTPEELEHQAKVIISAKWINGGASCNAPQNVIVSKHWKQRDVFVQALESAWQQAPENQSYYPGAPQRWRGFQQAYPKNSKIVFNAGSKQTVDNIDDTHLPLLMVSTTENLSTEADCAKDANEYTLRNEAFAPVLVVITMEDDDFLPAAVSLSNQYMFGSLSMTLAVPSSATNSPDVAKAIADLKYGAVCTNGWAGSAYMTWPLAWGGVHGEKLESVESGIGNVINCMLFDKIEKCVSKTPCVSPAHFDFCKPREEQIGMLKFITALTMGLDPALVGTM